MPGTFSRCSRGMRVICFTMRRIISRVTGIADRRRLVRAHVGAGAFGIVRQPHAPLRILVADGQFKQRKLSRRVVDQRRQNFAHQLLVVQCDIPQLLPVENGA